MTKQYIGTKIILAWSAEKDGKPGYGVKYEDGYISWSPKEAFEPAYRAIEGDGQALSFGDALHMLKQGKKVARAGWNGKGMWLTLVRAASWSIDPEKNGTGGYSLDALPWIGMKTVSEGFVPWLASQTDMLAEDWAVIE